MDWIYVLHLKYPYWSYRLHPIRFQSFCLHVYRLNELLASDAVTSSSDLSAPERSSVDDVTSRRYPVRQRCRPDRYTPSDFGGRNM